MVDVKVADGLVIAGNLGSYRVAMYDASGNSMKLLSRDEVTTLRLPGVFEEEGRRSIVGLGSLAAPVPIGGGYWIAVSSWPVNVDDPDEYVRRRLQGLEIPAIQWAAAVDVLDWERGVLWSAASEGSLVPEIGIPVVGGSAAEMYSVVAYPFPQVRKYGVDVILSPATDGTRSGAGH
jgi:hypothetical protein